jgi:hypothetical protein
VLSQQKKEREGGMKTVIATLSLLMFSSKAFAQADKEKCACALRRNRVPEVKAQ